MDHKQAVDDDSDSWSTASEDKSDEDLAALLQKMQAMPTGSNKCCLTVGQGEGGIYTLPLRLPKKDHDTEVQRTTAICTTGCMTCVGVYIPIDDQRCFAAHFDGSLYKPLHDRNINAWQIPGDLVKSFRKAVRATLDRTFQDLQQEVEAIRQREDLKDRAVVVCFWPVVGQQKGPGFHIIEVLCEYFQLDKAKLASKYRAQHGFVVNHFDKTPQSVQLLGWTRPGPTEEVLDEIAKLADNCAKPLWGDNFRSVFRTTYEYVMPWDLESWWEMRPLKYGSEDRPWSWEYDESKDAWVT